MTATAAAERVNHPLHYGGDSNPYEAIKVIEAWGLGFCLGNVVKYISRAGKKTLAHPIEDLEKAAWYLDRAALSNSPNFFKLCPSGYTPLVVAIQWGLSPKLGGVLVEIFSSLQSIYPERGLQRAFVLLVQEIADRNSGLT